MIKYGKIPKTIMKFRLLSNKHFWFDLKYKIKCFFFPKQEWLTNVIPDTFCDKVELIPNILFACLVDYIEVEKKQNFIHDIGYDWAEELKDGFVTQTYVDAVNLREEELMRAYDYIKRGRDVIQARIDWAYPPREPLDELFTESETVDGHYELTVSPERTECYKEVNRLEAIKLEKDKECMRIIVRHHHQLWT